MISMYKLIYTKKGRKWFYKRDMIQRMDTDITVNLKATINIMSTTLNHFGPFKFVFAIKFSNQIDIPNSL